MSVDLGALFTRLEIDTSGLTKAESKIIAFAKKAGGALAGVFAVDKVKQAIVDVTLATARYDTLGVVMNNVGKNAGYSAKQMAEYEKQVRASGISMTKTREIVTRMTQAQIDLTKSSKLARIAQDAAVIGNIDSSESFSRMIHGIQSAQVEVLRGIGINVNFENSYKKLAAQLNVTTADLTEYQKMQARTNAVLEEGTKISGTYATAMGTPQKKLLSLNRYISNTQVLLGRIFQPSFGKIIDEITQKIKAFGNSLENSDLRFWGELLGDIVKVFLDFDDVVDRVQKKLEGTSFEGPLKALKDANDITFDKLKNALPVFGSIRIALKGILESTNQPSGSFFDTLADKAKAAYKKMKQQFMTPEEIVADNLKEVLQKNYVDPWQKAAESAIAAQENATNKQSRSLAILTKEYEKHKDNITSINEKIRQSQLSGQELLRELKRSGMGAVDAWKDIKKQVQEYSEAAKNAQEQGKFDQAVEYYDKAIQLSTQLNKSVSEGGKTYITQQQGLKTTIGFVEDLLKKKEEALKGAKQVEIDALNSIAKEGNYENGLKAMENIKEKANDITAVSFPAMRKGWKEVWTGDSEKTEGAILKIKDTFTNVFKSAVSSSNDATSKMISNINKVKSAASSIKYSSPSSSGRGYRYGGLIQKLREGGEALDARMGRFLPGYGGGDKVDLKGEAGEYMINKEATAEAGKETAADFNRKNWRGVVEKLIPKLRTGGPVGSIVKRPQFLQTGGMAMQQDSNLSINKFYFGNDPSPVVVSADPNNTQRLVQELKRRYNRRS